MADKIKALEARLSTLEADPQAEVRQKIDVLNDLAWALSDTDMQRAQSLSETAYSLAESPDKSPASYQAGLAYSLRTQGYLNMRHGDHATGLSQLFQAQEICESLQLAEGLVDVLDHIAGVYFQIGNFAEALSYMYRQLEAAQQLGDSRLIANAYNNLVAIYTETGDYGRAIETLRDNLQRAAETDYKRIEFISYANLAETYMRMGNYEPALENAQRGLQVSQAAGFELFEVYAFDLIGKAHLELGETDQAIHHLKRALALSRKIGSGVTESLILLDLSRAYRDLGQFDVALDYGRQGIDTAQAIDAKLELFNGHLLLSEIYEQQGDLAQSLHHLKQYQTFKELVLGEKADQRLKVLQVAHDTQAAKKEAEIHRLHNVELKQEIAGRKQIEETLRISQERYHLATHAAGAGVWDWNLQTGEFYLDPVIKAILGYGDDEIPNDLDVWADYIHPDDRQAVMEAAQAHIDGRTPDYTFEHRMLHKDGLVRWVMVQGRVINDEQGRAVRMVGTDADITELKESEIQVQRQLKFVRALSAFSQTLLETSGSEADNRRLLVKALQHLIEPAEASKIFLYENFDDPELGFCSRFIVDACAPGIPSLLDHPEPNSAIIPWSIVPKENHRRLAAGEPVGGPVEALFAPTPPFRDYLLNEVNVLSVQFFPIHFGEYWWGYVGFDDRTKERVWSKHEITLLGTAAEMLTSTLQRWQAEEKLRTMNDRLERQVKNRTTELADTITMLQQEINERERAEADIQQMVETLEERVAARTEELATFFDLTLLAGQAVNLIELFEQALPRIVEVTRSRAICVHVADADYAGMCLVAQQNLSGEARTRLESLDLPPSFQNWLQQPNDPLLTTALSQMTILPPAFRLPEFQSYLGAQIRVGGKTEGILSCYRFSNRGFGVDDIALVTALAEQMGMMLETQRLRQDAQEMAVLEERQRLARDLHDSVTQSLYSMSLFARSGHEALADADMPRLEDSLAQLEDNAVLALKEMRLLLYQLLPVALEVEGLTRALDLRFDAVERRLGMAVDYQVAGSLYLSQAMETEVYRIAIEALNNVLRHAGASAVRLHIRSGEDRLELEVGDNGQGFDLDHISNGMGLQNMQERAKSLGGTLRVLSTPGQGTQVLLAVPIIGA